MDPDTLVTLAERLRKAGVQKIRLAGGEPVEIEFYAEDPLGLGKLDEHLENKTADAAPEKTSGYDAALKRMAGRAS